MEQISSALHKSGDMSGCLQGLKTSETCVEPSAQSYVPRPHDVLLETSTPRIHESAGEGTEVAAVGPLRIGLPDLCVDILLMVAVYLPPSSQMSLGYSCSKIRDKLDFSTKSLLGERYKLAQLPRSALRSRLPRLIFLPGVYAKWCLPTMAQNVHHAERLNLLCMLDRDGKIPPSKAVCSGCADTHDRSLFSSESLAQSSSERRCLGSAGRIWVCPHWIFDHNLVTTSSKLGGSHACGKKRVAVVTVDHAFTDTEPTIMWPIAVLRGSGEAPSKKLVEGILARTDLRVCKHLNFSDNFVSSLYNPDCKKLWTHENDPICPCPVCTRQPQPATAAESLDSFSGGTCESCGTNLCFTIRANRDGEKELKLVIRRKILRFQGCTDWAWIEQVDAPRDFEELERKWRKARDEDIEEVLLDLSPYQ